MQKHEGEGAPASGWKRRARRILAAAISFVAALLLLVTALLVLVASSPGRRRICAEVGSRATAALAGSVELGRCEALTLWHVRVAEVTIRSADGEVMISAESVDLRPHLPSLLSGKIRARSLIVEGPVVSLAAGDGQLALLEALTPVESDADEDDDGDAEGSIPSIVVDELRIHGGQAREMPQGLLVRALSVDGRVEFDEHLEVTVRDVTASLDRGQSRDVVELTRLAGEVRLRPGAESHLEAEARSSEDRLSVVVDMRWGAEGPEHVGGEVSLALSPELLERLGQPDAAAALSTPVRGTIRGSGSLEDFTARADLETEGGPLTVAIGIAGERLEASIETSGLELSRVAAAAPAGELAGHVSAVMDDVFGDAPERPLVLEVRDLTYGDYALPLLTARGALEPTAVRVESLSLPHLTREDGRLELEGRVGFDGAAELTLDASLPEVDRDGNIRLLAPGVRGALDATVRGRISAGDDARLDVEGRVVLRRFEAPDVGVERAEARGFVRGPLTAPVLSVDVTAANVRSGDLTVREAVVSARGGPREYEVDGHAALVDGRDVDLDLGVTAHSGAYEVEGALVAGGLWEGPLRIAIEETLIDPSREVTIGRARATGRGLAASASGVYRFRGRSSLAATVTDVDLSTLDRFLGLDRGLVGSVSGRVAFAGTPQRPEAEVAIRINNASLESIPIPRAVVEARLGSGEGVAELTADLDLATYGDVAVRARAELGNERDPVAALRRGVWDVTAEVDDLSLAIVQLLAPDSPDLEGSLDATLRVRGTVEDVRAALDAQGRGLAAPEMRPVDLDLDADLAEGILSLDASATDEHGALASVVARASVDVAALARGGDPAAILAEPWSMTLNVPRRPLRAMPVAMPDREELPESVQVDAELCGGEGPIQGDVTVVARWPEEVTRGEQWCRPGPPPELEVSATLREGETVVRASADLPEGEVAEATVQVATPVDDWLVQGFPQGPAFPAIVGQVLVDVPLAAVPVACRRASGRVVLTASADQLLGDEPSLLVEGEIVELLLAGEEETVQLELSLAMASAAASTVVRMRAEDREAMVLRAEAPVRWGGDNPVPELVDESWEALLRFDRAPVAPLIAPLPNVSQPSGSLDGELTLRGRGADVTVGGEVSFAGLGVTIHEPFQRIDDLQGTLGFVDDGIVISGVELRDRDGLLELDGRVRLEEWSPTGLELSLVTRRFPLRSEGVVFARATSRIRLEADLQADPRTALIVVQDAEVALPDEGGRVVQPLDQHPDVVYESQPEFALALGESPADPAALPEDPAAPDVPIVVTVDASDPFWVRHTDFALQLTADLRATVAEGVPRIEGSLRVRRGFLSMLGKSFDFEPGELTFAGGRTIDPLLDLSAVHTLQSDDTVTVHIGGRLSAPELDFSTTVPGVTTEREILALLVTGRSRDPAATAEDEAVSMLASITAGLLGSLARRQLGGFIPVLAIESHGTGDTRVRAGIQADRLIPRWLRGVIRGVYVEGFVGTEQEGEESNTGVTGGGAIELYFPYDLVTSGAYEEPDNWSVDLTWEP